MTRVSEIGVAHVRIRLDSLRQIFSDLAAVEENANAVGEAENHVHVVLDDHDRHTRRDALQQLHRLAALPRTHAGGRFVEQKHARFGGKRQSDFESPLLAISELACQCVGAIAQLYRGDRGVDVSIGNEGGYAMSLVCHHCISRLTIEAPARQAMAMPSADISRVPVERVYSRSE